MLQRMGGVGLGLEDYCAIQIVGDNYRIVQAKKEAKAHKVFKIRAKTLHENIAPNEKWTPIILCGGLAEIDRNRVTVLVNDVEELVSIELSEATQKLENAAVAVENAETSKARLDASIELKKATARVEAINYLS